MREPMANREGQTSTQDQLNIAYESKVNFIVMHFEITKF